MGKSVLMVIAPRDFRDEELLVPKEMFEKAGMAVTVASVKAGEARGVLGRVVKVDAAVSGVNASDFDAVVFVGGGGVDSHSLFENANFLDLARNAYRKGKIVSAICLAPKILANAGLLEGKRATVWLDGTRSQEKYIEARKAMFRSESVVRDGSIITACGPSAAKEFAESIIGALT